MLLNYDGAMEVMPGNELDALLAASPEQFIDTRFVDKLPK